MRTLHCVQPSLPLPQVAHGLRSAFGSYGPGPTAFLRCTPAGAGRFGSPKALGLGAARGLPRSRSGASWCCTRCSRATLEQLEFHLCDSPTYRSFCLVGLGKRRPKRSTLHRNISCIRPQTLQALHQILVEHAVLSGLESGSMVRTDTTPVAASCDPTDSALLGMRCGCWRVC